VTVFVSYSSRDKDAVKSLTQDLQDADEQVWLDQRLAGGDAWWRAILEQIRGCDVFIFALSQNSIQSKPCQAELHYAQALGLPILPVQVGPVDSMQLNPLATVQAIDYRSSTPNTGMRLSAALQRERARRQPLPSPLPDEPEVPFEYLIRLYTTVAGPDQLSPRDQAALVAQLRVGLREDGDHDATRNDIVTLLTKLRDREDVTYRTRTDVEAILASIDSQSAAPPPSVANPALPTSAPEPTHLDDSGPITPAPAAQQQPADLNLAATQYRPSGWPPVPQPRPGDRPPPQFGTPPPLWGQRPRRPLKWPLIAAIVVIVAILAAASITGYLVFQRSRASQTPSARPGPPVSEAALQGLLLSSDQLNTALGITGMGASTFSTVIGEPGASVSDKACLPLGGPGGPAVYAGSGWSAVREKLDTANADPVTQRFDPSHFVSVFQVVVLFPAAHDADTFFTSSAQSWPNCATRQFTTTVFGATDVWTVGPVSNTNGTLSATKTDVNGGCQRALTVANNVAIDISVCRPSQYDGAVNIAHQIAAKVPS
jgi:serine/threonine kinase PknH